MSGNYPVRCSLHTVPRRYTGTSVWNFSRSLGHLGEEGLNFGFEGFEFGVDFGQGAGWLVDVEVAGEGDLVADLRLRLVDPGVGDVGEDLAAQVLMDVLVQGDVFVVTQLWVGFRLALLELDLAFGVTDAADVAQLLQERLLAGPQDAGPGHGGAARVVGVQLLAPALPHERLEGVGH